MSSSSMLVAKYLTSLQMLIEGDATSHKSGPFAEFSELFAIS